MATAQVLAHDRLDAYAPAAWAAGLGQVVADGSFDAVVAPGSERGTEVLAHLAARTGLPMAANVIAVEPGERWKVTRHRWAGSLLEEAWLDGSPHLLTVAPHGVAALTGSYVSQATQRYCRSALAASHVAKLRRIRRTCPEAGTARHRR